MKRNDSPLKSGSFLWRRRDESRRRRQPSRSQNEEFLCREPGGDFKKEKGVVGKSLGAAESAENVTAMSYRQDGESV